MIIPAFEPRAFQEAGKIIYLYVVVLYCAVLSNLTRRMLPGFFINRPCDHHEKYAETGKKNKCFHMAGPLAPYVPIFHDPLLVLVHQVLMHRMKSSGCPYEISD
jgi:hypothetical protein